MMAPRWLRDWFQPRADHRAEPITAQEAARRLAERQHARRRNRFITTANEIRSAKGLPLWPLRPE